MNRHLLHFVSIIWLAGLMGGCATEPQIAKRDSFDPLLLVQKPVSTLPLINAGNRQWWVRAEVDGHEGLFAVDTGAANTIITPQFARKITASPDIKNLSTEKPRIGQKINYINIPSLRLGGILYVDFYAPILNLDHINQAMRSHIDGILGLNLLGKTVCSIDWRKNTLTLKGQPENPPADAIPLFPRDHRLYLNARINEQAISLVLDTGAYRSCLGKDDMSRLKIPESNQALVEAPRIDLTESHRRLEQTQVVLREFQVGPINQPNYGMLTWNHSVLGMDLLEPWILTFDAQAGWMTLTKGEP